MVFVARAIIKAAATIASDFASGMRCNDEGGDHGSGCGSTSSSRKASMPIFLWLP